MFFGIRSDAIPVSFGMKYFCTLSACQNIMYNRWSSTGFPQATVLEAVRPLALDRDREISGK